MPRQFHSHKENIILHVIPASQYSTKVLAGLVCKSIPHYLEFAEAQPPKRTLPSGGHMVPELEYQGHAIADSASIFRFLDDHVSPALFPDNKFFPTEEAVGREVVDRVARLERFAEEVLDIYCNYFNFVHQEGYARSIRQSLARYIPWWAFWISIDVQLAEKREKERLNCHAFFIQQQQDRSSSSSSSSGNGCGNDVLETSMVEKAWDKVLLSLEAEFVSAEQETIAGSPHYSAADFAIFAKIARLQDHLGDVSIGAGLLGALNREGIAVPRLQAWYHRIQRACPLVWRNKRVPASP
jgi:hypothetical protein